MKILYLDCGMGAAGDMLTAALLELLPDPDSFIDKLNSIGIPGARFARESSIKCGITGTHMSVTVNGTEEDESITGNNPSAHGHVTDRHDHDAERHEHHHGRNVSDIEHIISKLDMPETAKADAMSVYRIISDAESKVHGVPVTDIHFHEVGTLDAIADITAVSLLMNEIAPDETVISPIHVGSGHVNCAHGTVPVPAPATALILKNIPAYGGSIEGELCTPTGAALLKHFADRFGSMPPMKTSAIGYGMGKKDFPQANCLRAMLGETAETGSVENHSADSDDTVLELSCNVDDMTAEAVSFAMDRLFDGGALEVYTAPIGMKKSRPGTLIRVMCRESERENIIRLLFKHTTTIGVRETVTRRHILDRKIESIATPYGEVHRKISHGYGVSRMKYEYDDLSRIAKENDLSLADTTRLVERYAPEEEKDIRPQKASTGSGSSDTPADQELSETEQTELAEKKQRLEKYLKNLESVAVAFSSGVDSTFLLKTAHDVLGEKAAAVTAFSPSFPSREFEEARTFCEKEGIRHLIVEADVLSNEDFVRSPENRCYICKHDLMSKIIAAAEESGFSYVAEGSNMDDLGDYRPGLAAISELDVKSPLKEAGLTKKEIRILSKETGLSTWDKPSFACLVSRIPYGERITNEKLEMIEKAEQALLDLGLTQVRVRIHGDPQQGFIARIETEPSDFDKIISPGISEHISQYLKSLGFLYVTLDFGGYQAGSMNLNIKKDIEIKIFDTLPESASNIRKDVFIREQSFSEEFDDIDKTATHLVAFQNGIPAATCRIFEDNSDLPGGVSDDLTFILGRLAVRKEYRGKGLGADIMKKAEETAASKGAKTLKLHAQLQAKPFYEKLGYKPFGDMDREENTPHIWMQKTLV